MVTSGAEVSSTDRDGILASATGYIESWLDGDADRMARCLHPDLAKRTVRDPAAKGCTVENLTRDQMVAATRSDPGTRRGRPYEISILDAYGDIATVRVFSGAYMDYLHVAHCGDQWLLVNVLWQYRPS
jgi:hypothetical protein